MTTITPSSIAVIMTMMISMSSCSAFVIVPSSSPRMTSSSSSSSLYMANSKNIRIAMDLTEQYGIQSQEAKLAWETVEEFDARSNDNAAYTQDSEGMSKLTEEEWNKAYYELQQSMELMERNDYSGLNILQNNQQLMKDVAAELSAIKLSRKYYYLFYLPILDLTRKN
jgi:hypothetical protein